MVKKVKENMFIIDKEKSCLWNRKIKIEPSSRFAKSLSEITKKKTKKNKAAQDVLMYLTIE